MKLKIIIPIYYPDERFLNLLNQLFTQTIKNFSVLIIDSGSNINYLNTLKKLKYDVKKINARNFNHGGTRRWGEELADDSDIVVFFSQDITLFNNESVKNLVKMFSYERVGCAYGRQLPYGNATLFAKHARFFNYGENSYIRSLKDKDKYAIKTVFISDSFAAYRKNAIREIGGFPKDVILGEDMYVATKMLLSGWYIAYCADSKIYHSHNYSILEEGKRYFDIGVFHSREKWIKNIFGRINGEGMKFILSEFIYLIKNNPFLIFEMIVRNAVKFIGYQVGKREKYFSKSIKKYFSMNVNYWT